MWTFSTLCPSFLSGVVREANYKEDYTRDASCTQVLHNCAVLISDRVPQVPSLLCNREMRSLSSFLKPEKCSWGPAYWNFDKEHPAGALPSHAVICVLHSIAFWESLCLHLAPFVQLSMQECVSSWRGCVGQQELWGQATEMLLSLDSFCLESQLIRVEDGGTAPLACPSIPSGGTQASLNALMCPGKA